ncbi:hypothetical protein LNQ03_33260 [Klebsiella pneumoniae subsp. pneumoniae]|nr:hypothetical protein [Klebsiella pneumoniae subsp. pneumoniae]
MARVAQQEPDLLSAVSFGPRRCGVANAATVCPSADRWMAWCI